MCRHCRVAYSHLGNAGKGGLQRREKLAFQLRIDAASCKGLLDIAADILVEHKRIDDPVGIFAVAAHGNIDIESDISVDYTERHRRCRSILVAHNLLCVEEVDALVLAGVAAKGDTRAHALERRQDPFAYRLASAEQKARLCRAVEDKLARLAAGFDDGTLLHDDHVLPFVHCDHGAVRDDVVLAAGIGRASLRRYAFAALGDEGVCIERIAIEVVPPGISKNAADGTHASLQKSHGNPFSCARMARCLAQSVAHLQQQGNCQTSHNARRNLAARPILPLMSPIEWKERSPWSAAERSCSYMGQHADTFGRRVLAASCAGGVALCLALLALEAFGSVTPPEAGTPLVLQAFPFAAPGAYAVGPSSTSGLMILCAPAAAVWGFSVHIRCSDAQIRHRLKAIAALVGLWMLDVLIKYRSPIQDSRIIALLWYLYYVPMTAIPALCLLCAIRAAALDSRPWAAVLSRVLGAISIALVVLVLTNTWHLQVFRFDISKPDWQSFYSYGWGYWLAVAIYVAEYMAFFGFLLLSSRRQLRGIIGLLFMAAVPFAVYALQYALRYGLAFKTNFSLNYCLIVVALLELALDFGLLPSYAWYSEAFQRLPLDLKILERDGTAAYATDAAGPLPQEVLGLVLEAAQPRTDAQVTRLRTSAIPHMLFKAYGVSGGAVLLSEDVSFLDRQHQMLRERQERLRRSNQVLRHESGVRRELWRLESEQRLLSSIETSISDKVGRIQELLSQLPKGTGPDERAARWDILTEVKLLVAYCKRKGALVLSAKSSPAIDRDRLQLVFNETASDLRSIGVDCAACVDVKGVLPAGTVSVLYDCLYDVASAALFAADPILMIFVSEEGADVVMRVALEAAQVPAGRLDMAAWSLRKSLDAQGGGLSLETSSASLNAALRLRVPKTEEEGG